jgi:hypothetical protein
MATAESGTWKLLLYPVIIIFVIGVVLNLVVTPFTDGGVVIEKHPTFFSSSMQNIIDTGNVFNISVISIPLIITTLDIPVPNIFHLIPNSALVFIQQQVNIYSWLPEVIQIPIAIIFIFCFAYALWVLVAMLIP